MKPPILADAGPLYAAADPDDANNTRSQRETERLTREKRTLLILYPTLLEGHTLVQRRLGKRVSDQWLADIVVSALTLNAEPEDYRQAINRIARYPDQDISLFDAVVAVVAERIRAEVWTYDHHFDVMGARVWR